MIFLVALVLAEIVGATGWWFVALWLTIHTSAYALAAWRGGLKSVVALFIIDSVVWYFLAKTAD